MPILCMAREGIQHAEHNTEQLDTTWAGESCEIPQKALPPIALEGGLIACCCGAGLLETQDTSWLETLLFCSKDSALVLGYNIVFQNCYGEKSCL